ncbi:MAG: PAS domain S-box protein [Gemmatimonadota bacterium]|nr:PAS domain S-box protein [Gemmatimonadota bacterium]
MTDSLAGSARALAREAQLAALLRELPPAHRAVVEQLDQERVDQVRAAERHAVAIQWLQEASVAIARVLERDAIHRELARHAARLATARAAFVVDATAGDPAVVAHWDGTVFVEAPPAPAAIAIAQEAIRTAKPALAVDGGERVVALPLRAGHRVDAAVAVLEPTSADAGVANLLAALAATAAAALGTAAIVSESMRDRRQSEALAELARALSDSHRLGEVLHLGLRHSCAILGTDGADIMLLRGDYLHIVAASGCSAPSQGVYVPVAETAVGRAMLEDRSVIANAITDEVRASPVIRDTVGVTKFAAVPMRNAEGPIGVLSVVNREMDFGEADIRVLERLASQLAVAVEKVRLFEEASDATRELRAAFDAIAGGMAVVDADGFIQRHNARLAAIADRPETASLAGHSLYEVLLGAPEVPSAHEPIGAALVGREVGRGLVRRPSGERVFEVVASPHPNGGAVVTADDVTSFLALAERHRLVVESTTDAILITDEAGIITFANDAACSLFGRPVANAGLRLGQLVAEEARARSDDAALRALAGHAGRFDAEVMRPDGDRRVVSASLAPVRGPAGVTGYVASLRDATEEAHARAAMVAADSRYRNLFESAGDAIFTVDAAGIVTSANEACARACGLPRDAIVGSRLTTLMDPSETGGVAVRHAVALSGRGTQFECAVAHNQGASRLMSVTFSPVLGGGEVTGVLGIARDVTAERAQAAALERAESRYARLVESAEDGICTLDEEGHVTSANRSFRRIVGVTRRELSGRHFTDFVPPPQRAVAWELFAGALAGARQRSEIRFTVPAGDAIVSVRAAPLVEHDRVAGVLVIVRDVTEERALLNHAARRDKLAALGELVGGVAHEVNSPLTGILAHAQLLQADFPPDSEARRAADTIVNEARRAARIVGKLLTFARQNPTERIPTDINQVILDTLELRRYPLRMQEVDLRVRLGDGLPAVWADPFQLQQVLINLLSNAEQAVVAAQRPERWIEIGSEQRGREIVVTVTDSGPGIAPEHLASIFNPFYTTKPRGIGTGLGLSISFGIVREHGGFIQASSPPGQGATFEVHLPIRDARTSAPGR